MKRSKAGQDILLRSISDDGKNQRTLHQIPRDYHLPDCKFLWNFIFYAGTKFPTVAQNSVLSVVENVSGIAFAYPTNRRWVFQSKNPNILAEFVSFVGSRAATWILGWLMNMLLVNVLGVSVFISTVVVGVLVVIGNYVFSKLLVFRKKK